MDHSWNMQIQNTSLVTETVCIVTLDKIISKYESLIYFTSDLSEKKNYKFMCH